MSWRTGLTLAGWVAGGMAFAWLLSLGWWLVLEPATANDDVYELTIPRGTAAAVERGEPPPFIPNSLELGRNRMMIVRNEDVVEHRVGSWTVPPGGVAEVQASATRGEVTCTITPAGVLEMTYDERPPILTTLNAALVLGLPLGAVVGFARLVGGRLRTED